MKINIVHTVLLMLLLFIAMPIFAQQQQANCLTELDETQTVVSTAVSDLTNDVFDISNQGAQANTYESDLIFEQTTAKQPNLLISKKKQKKQQVLSFAINDKGKAVTFRMILVEAGSFKMGSEYGYKNEMPVHKVKITEDYYIGETEVTQELWEAVMGKNPSNFKGAQKPVESVSWNDCQTFIKILNVLTGKKFRLPTEAEWEYAALGGKKWEKQTYAGSNKPGDIAWFRENANQQTHPVAEKKANIIGLYDMGGNVWEWCADWFDFYMSKSTVKNPTGPTTGNLRVCRGGSWNDNDEYCRTTNRHRETPTEGFNNLGLRLAM